MEESKNKEFLTGNLVDRNEKEKFIRELAESECKLNIRLINDFAFKKTFHNKKALTGLLSALLDMPAGKIEELEFPDTFLDGEYEDGREGILDVRVHLNNQRRINIEIQVLEYPYWEERSLFYLSKMFVDGFSKGENYSKLEESIQISILGFDLPHADHYYSVIRLMDEKTHTIYSDKLSLRMLYLKQLDNVSEEELGEEVYKWAKLISAKDWKVLIKMAENNEYMRAAVEEMEKINSDKELRYRYLKKEMELSDETTIREYYLSKGWEKGKASGEQFMLGLIKAMMKDGMGQEEIERLETDDSFKDEMVKKYIQ
ncbi:Rpn family recombination-promoting nuclease/putative transposase [Clostridium sp. MCC353]|uniref:Rpn family recombination-promoting nuclease/putative transposase n=1 Tax=Clostridium sp. MCC353 TaxID=2592646 RepID=UPI001C01EDD5|nr:Rpn family recombination-promoting nuclease/putative transposase [Clostridium sp. MCC353]MBT9779522.1 Rpn family recombination-promoting nuclease/putative transposase [Clostridium sp. MCC353]